MSVKELVITGIQGQSSTQIDWRSGFPLEIKPIAMDLNIEL